MARTADIFIPLQANYEKMKINKADKLWSTLALRYKSHPWHGIEIGDQSPEVVTAFIEMTPNDTVKYEIDKESGYLMIDRPQKFSNIVPALYGFIPQTYCAEEVATFCQEQSGKKNIVGDKDPLDICVLTEREITQGNIIVHAIPIGGFRMIDHGEADDKIIAIMKGDEVYSEWNDVHDMPPALINRLKHYFLTYKAIPHEQDNAVEITHTYSRDEALEVIRRSQKDYQSHYGSLSDKLGESAFEAVNLGQRVAKKKNNFSDPHE